MHRRTLLAALTGLVGTTLFTTSQAHATTPNSAKKNDFISTADLAHQITAAQTHVTHGHYLLIHTQLPALITQAHKAHRQSVSDTQRAACQAHLAELHILAGQVAIKLGHQQRSELAAHHALRAATASHDILLQARAQRAQAITLRRAGKVQQGQQLLLDTATLLQPELHRGPDYLATYSALVSTASYTAAVNGDRDNAQTFLQEATTTAYRLTTKHHHRRSTWTPLDVDLYRLSNAWALGDYGIAIEIAHRINPTAIPSAERQARYWTDVARVYSGGNKPDQCYQALLAAEHAVPEELRRPSIQRITLSLLQHRAGNTLPGLRAFAHRTGAIT